MLTTILSINMFKFTINFEHVTFKAPHSCWYLRTEDDLYIQNWKGPIDMTVDRTFPTLVPMNGKVLLQYFKLHSVKIFCFLPYVCRSLKIKCLKNYGKKKFFIELLQTFLEQTDDNIRMLITTSEIIVQHFNSKDMELGQFDHINQMISDHGLHYTSN
jgi:hypothetical protein